VQVRKALSQFSRRLIPILAFVYPLTLLGLIVAFRYVGERYWLTSVGLYLPRIGFALPLPLIALGLLLHGRRRLLWTQAAALGLVLVLMGLSVPLSSAPPEGARSFRVMSFNITSCDFGTESVARAIAERSPDLLLLQEATWQYRLKSILEKEYSVVHEEGEFMMASRFPLREVTVPEPLRFYGKEFSLRFVRYVIETPLGPTAVYNVHPISPRGAFRALGRAGARGRPFSGAAAPYVEGNAELRQRQLDAVAQSARAEKLPVIIAGDTNSPALSPALAEAFGAYRDGFREVGLGFGHTFPAWVPWLRLDRIFSSHDIGFSKFEVGCKGASDHLCVTADLYRR
jgi:endonuclease/exonuclease/phosphatase family metal-dependent hydrolase